MATTREEADALGLTGEMTSPFALRWDATGRESGSEDSDFGWIGEDKHGVWLKTHPSLALANHPEVAAIASECLFDRSAPSVHEESSWRFQAKAACLNAIERGARHGR